MTTEQELQLYKLCLWMATQSGYTYQYEGWGGRQKSGRKTAEEYRTSLMTKAMKELGIDEAEMPQVR